MKAISEGNVLFGTDYNSPLLLVLIANLSNLRKNVGNFFTQ